MSLAKSYAQALYQAAADANTSKDAILNIETQFNTVLQLLDQSKDLKVALLGPVITAKEKSSVISGLAPKAGLSPLMQQFLDLLARKGRLNLIAEISEAFNAVRLEAEGGVSGKLVSAEQISDEDVQGMANAFTKKLGKRVSFRVSTDPSLLAGMKVTVNGVTYDGTLRSQLHRLRDKLVQGLVQG